MNATTLSPDLPPLPPRRQLLVVDGFPVMGYDEDDLLAYAAASRAGAAAPPDRSPGPITFYESDGTERRLIWEYGDHSVGIQDGYTPDDNAWEDHALSAATGSPPPATGNSDQKDAWVAEMKRLGACGCDVCWVRHISTRNQSAAMSASTTQTQEPSND